MLDGNGNLLSVTDAYNRVTTHEYDAANRRTDSVLPGNRTLQWTWTVHGELESETDARHGTTVHQYDTLGRLRSTVLPGPESATRQYQYDDADNLIAEIDARQHTTQYEYDGRNRRIRQIDPPVGDGTIYEQQWGYDQADNLIEHTDRLGILTTHRYDGENRLLETSRSGVRLSRLMYDGDGNLVLDTDALGRSTSYEYDHAGRQLHQTRPLNAVATWHYDPIGNVLQETDADGYTRHYEYDRRQRRTAHSEAVLPAADPAEYRTLTEYDLLDRPLRVQRAHQHAWLYAYHPEGWLHTITDPLAHVTRYQYDANGNHTQQIDARNRTTRFEYDARDRLRLRRYPDTQQEHFEYDAESNRIEHIDAAGQVRRFHYDALNRQTRAEYPEAIGQPGEAHRIDVAYDAEGRRIQVTEHASDLPTRSSHYSYDDFGRLISETDVHGQLMSHAYDLVGNRLRRSDISGTTHYEHDDLNRVVALLAPGRDAVVYHYSPAGRVQQIEHPGGARSEQHYNERGRISHINHYQGGQRSAHYAYHYDEVGNRIQQIEDLGQGEVETVYQYDPADRLIETTRAGRRTVYVLNEVANRTEERRYHDGTLSEHRQLHYNQRDQLTEITDGEGQLLVENHYDPRGNRIATIDGGTHTVYRFGARDRLLGIHLQGAPPETGPRYRYDDAGFRIEELRPEQGLRFRYDGSQLAFETNVVGNLLTRYQHGPDRLLAETRNSQTLTWLTDALKTPVKRLSDDGSSYSTSHYDEYGKLESETSPDTPRFGFTGYQRSEGTELYYAEQRWYDASSGRFISEDPLWGDPQTPLSLHRYLYAYANPTVWVDPDGRQARWASKDEIPHDASYWEASYQGRVQYFNTAPDAYSDDMGYQIAQRIARDAGAEPQTMHRNALDRLVRWATGADPEPTRANGAPRAREVTESSEHIEVSEEDQIDRNFRRQVRQARDFGQGAAATMQQIACSLSVSCSAHEAATGQDQQGERLSGWERALAALPVGLVVAGKVSTVGNKAAPSLASDFPYSSHAARLQLEATHGAGNVTSTTVPHSRGRNVHLAGRRHPITGIVFDPRGFPIFDDVARYDTRLPVEQFRGASYTQQMQMASNDLAEAIGRGQVRATTFSDAQLQQIRSGSARIDSYTWHHHQDTGRMQLVPRDIHGSTGHLGWERMSQGQ